MKKYRIFLFSSVFFLISCAHFSTQNEFKHIPWQKRQAKLNQQKHWFIRGAVSITYNKHRDIGSFEWTQKERNYAIDILAPMGLDSVRIVGNNNKAWFCKTKDKCVVAQSPEKLLYNQTGLRLPIGNMMQWLISLPRLSEKESRLAKHDQYGHLIAYEQDGWRIKCASFQAVKGTIDLPHIIEMSGKDVFIKVKIKEICSK